MIVIRSCAQSGQRTIITGRLISSANRQALFRHVRSTQPIARYHLALVAVYRWSRKSGSKFELNIGFSTSDILLVSGNIMGSDEIEVDLQGLVKIDSYTPIPPLILNAALSTPPFVSIPGIINLREVGSALPPSTPFRRNLIYRSGGLYDLPASSLEALQKDLSVGLILDLRSSREISAHPDPVIEGVQNLHLDSLRKPSSTRLEDFVEDGGKIGHVKMYEEILEIHANHFRKALEWVKDDRGPMLFHCTAGKDRTGVLAAIFLGIAGASAETIAFEYALTRIGIEPAREFLLQMLRTWGYEWDADAPGAKEFSESKKEFMLATLEMVRVKYGGIEGYVKGLGFNDEDMVGIRRVLRGE